MIDGQRAYYSIANLWEINAPRYWHYPTREDAERQADVLRYPLGYAAKFITVEPVEIDGKGAHND